MTRAELSDLDGLIEKVRDPGSRDLITEAVIAYRAGALRSSILLCWTAVFGDLIAKIRELAQGGNKAAGDYVARFDQNIGNPQKMLAYEREILAKAGEAFLMFDHRDQRIFGRLREDRNACAHPALAGADGHFSPTPELVRAHLAHALDRLFIRPPAQGKEALIRIWRDLDEDRLPVAWSDAVALIQTRHVEPATETLRRAIARGAASGLMLHQDPFHLKGHPGHTAEPALTRRRGFLACLEAVGRIDGALQATTLGEYSLRLEASGEAEPQLVAVLAVSWKPDLWGRLSAPSRSQIDRLLDQTRDARLSDESIKTHLLPALGCIAVPELAKRLLPLTEGFNAPLSGADADSVLIFERPPRRLITFLLERFMRAGSFRGAEHLFDRCVWPIREYLDNEDVERLLEAAVSKGQIWDAGGMQERLANLFQWLQVQRRAEAEAWTRFWAALRSNLDARSTQYRALYEALLAAGFITVDSVYAEEEE